MIQFENKINELLKIKTITSIIPNSVVLIELKIFKSNNLNKLYELFCVFSEKIEIKNARNRFKFKNSKKVETRKII